MGTRTVTYTFTGAEPLGAPFFTAPIPVFSGPFTLSWSVNGTAGIIWNGTFTLGKGTPVLGCWGYTPSLAQFQSSSGYSDVVGGGPFTWHCFDWELFQVGYQFNTQRFGAGRMLTFSITAAGIDEVTCAYGTEVIDTNVLAVIVDAALVTAATAAINKSWIGTLLATTLGLTVDKSVLCGTGPAVLPTPQITDLVNPGGLAVRYLFAVLWPYFCRCRAGTPAPVPPPLPVWTEPAGWPPPPTYPVNPTNPCLDLTEVRQKLDLILRQTGIDLELDTAMQRFDVPFGWIGGAHHDNITGSASFTVSRIIGVRIELVSPPPSIQLEGTPPYLWDLGWISASDDGAMLIEMRVTREVADWFPRHMELATRIGVFAKEGVTLRVTELLPEP
jgi:hypothetical protein